MGAVEGRPARDRLVIAMMAVHAVVWLVTLRRSGFNADEFQHLHLAWQQAQGRVVYRDVFDHHGPAYTLWNGLLLSLLPDPEQFGVIYVLRAQSLLLLGALTVATARLARALRDEPQVGWWAAASVTAAVVIADKGGEVRPDALQAVFTIAGLAAMLRGRPGVAGACFGAAGACNVKALVGPVVAVVTRWATRAHEPGAATREAAAIGAATLGVLGVVVAGFAAVGGARQLIYYNVVFNLRAAATAPGGEFSWVCVWFGLVHQTPLVVFMAAGSAGCLGGDRGLRARAAPLIAAAAALVWTGHRADMYGQFYVPVVPMVAAVGAAGVTALGARSPRAGQVARTGFLLGLAWCTGELLRWAALRGTDGRARETTQWVLDHVDRETPVAYTWNECGGFMFNPDPQYFWCRLQDNFGEASAAGAYGASFREALEGRRVPVIVAGEGNLRELPEATQRYVRARYVRRDPCLLVRRGSGLEADAHGR